MFSGHVARLYIQFISNVSAEWFIKKGFHDIRCDVLISPYKRCTELCTSTLISLLSCVCVCVSLLAASVCNTTHAERICQIELTWTSLTLTLHWSATPGRRLLTAFLTWRVILRVYWHTLF